MSEFAVPAPGSDDQWLICDTEAPLKEDCLVVVTWGRHVAVIGYVENRFPNWRRRLNIRYQQADGSWAVTRIFGRLSEGPADDSKVSRVVGIHRKLPMSDEDSNHE